VSKNGKTKYLDGIFYTFCKTATGRQMKGENMKMELGIGVQGMGINGNGSRLFTEAGFGIEDVAN
jgi:hypothetical protein